MNNRDIRRIVTEETNRLDPTLLGMRLANGQRRIGAILVDVVLIGVLVNAPSVVFGLDVAFVLLHSGRRDAWIC